MNPITLRARLDELLALQPAEVRVAAQNILDIPSLTTTPAYGIILRRPRTFFAFVFARLRIAGYELARSELEPATTDDAAVLENDFDELRRLLSVLLSLQEVRHDPRFALVLRPAEREAREHLVEAQEFLTTFYEQSNILGAPFPERDREIPEVAHIEHIVRRALRFPRDRASLLDDVFHGWFPQLSGIAPVAEQMTEKFSAFLIYAHIFLVLANEASPGLFVRLMTGDILRDQLPLESPRRRGEVASQLFLYFAMDQLNGGRTVVAGPALVYATVRSELSSIIMSGRMRARFFETVFRRFRYTVADPQYGVFAEVMPEAEDANELTGVDEQTMAYIRAQLRTIEQLKSVQVAYPVTSFEAREEYHLAIFNGWLQANSTMSQADAFVLNMLNNLSDGIVVLDRLSFEVAGMLALGRSVLQYRRELQQAVLETHQEDAEALDLSQQVDTGMLLHDPYAKEKPSMDETTGWVPPVRTGSQSSGSDDGGIGEDCLYCTEPLGGRYGEPPYRLPCCGNVVGLVCLQSWFAQTTRLIPTQAGNPIVPPEPLCPHCRHHFPAVPDVDYFDWYDWVFVPHAITQFTQQHRARAAGMPYQNVEFPDQYAWVPGPNEGPTVEEYATYRAWLDEVVRPLFQQQVGLDRAQFGYLDSNA